MYLEELIIEGFKSYATRMAISSWDPQFNAITGLNGSGKSNILDALCFVLGLTNLRQVRAANLADLVYKRGQAGITKASVTAVFNNPFIHPSVTKIARKLQLLGKSSWEGINSASLSMDIQCLKNPSIPSFKVCN
jgi:chromosome segregation ATPase